MLGTIVQQIVIKLLGIKYNCFIDRTYQQVGKVMA